MMNRHDQTKFRGGVGLPLKRVCGLRGRLGFTLTEVLLALGLTGLLLGAVYTGMTIYRQLLVTGKRDVELSQLSRAIQNKMVVDIRSVIFQPSEEDDEAELLEGEDGETADDETTTIEVTDPTEALIATSKGVIGNSDTLLLHISQPVRGGGRLSVLSGTSQKDHASDLLSVSYFLAGKSLNALSDLVVEKTGQTGLVRMVGDRLALETSDSAGDTEVLVESATVLSPEVVSLQFRYFDGVELIWVDEWDSTVSNSLPRAIEITIGFRASLETGSSQEANVTANDDNEMGEAVTVQRFVVALPVANIVPDIDAELLEP